MNLSSTFTYFYLAYATNEIITVTPSYPTRRSSELVDGLRLNEGAHRLAAIERTHDRIAVERAEQEPQPALRDAVIVDDQDIMLCHHAHAPPARYGLISRFCGHRNPNNIEIGRAHV